MPSIEWNPRFATGIASIDAQHKNLVESIRKLQHAIETGQAQAQISELMQFLIGYVEEHFALEEAYMEHIHYPELSQHRAFHEQLRRRVNSLNDRLIGGEQISPIELTLLLFEWLRDHIIHDDLAYVAHARERKGLKA